MASNGNRLNPNHSYSLHYCHLRIVLVSKSPDGENYSTWRKAMVYLWLQNLNWITLKAPRLDKVYDMEKNATTSCTVIL